MNKKGVGDLIKWNVAYLILALLFVVGMFFFVSGNQNGAPLMEDFYSKEIAKLINSAEPGVKIKLDVTDVMKLAQKNKVADLSKIIIIDNEEKEVIVKLTPNSGAVFPYFNDVIIFEQRVEYVSDDLNSNFLVFEIR